MTPEEHIRFLCRFGGVEDIDTVVNRTIIECDLQDCQDISAIHLNIIQKKRLMFALTLLGHTKVVLLDNPTHGMDVASKRHIWQQIRKEKRNRIIIVATQDMEEAQAIGDRIGVISHGELKLCGSQRFFDEKFEHSVKLSMSLPRNQKSEGSGQVKEELKEFVLSCVAEQYKNDVKLKWGSLE